MAGYAVLIGINKFEKYPHATLRYCARDAQELGTALSNCSHLVHDFERIEVVIDREATRNHIIDTIDNCFSSAGPGDQIWLFIASHGYRRNTSNYILTHDTRAGAHAVKDGTSLKLEEIRRLMASSNASEKLILLDCCHASSADFIERTGGEDAFSPRAVKSAFASHAFVFLNACTEGQVAHEAEEFKHGIWTHFLIEALHGSDGAWSGDGLLTVQTLHDFLHEQVSKYVRDKLNKQQHPDCELKTGLARIILGRKGRTVEEQSRKPRKIDFLKNVSNSRWQRQFRKLITTIEENLVPVLGELSQQGTVEALEKLGDQWRALAHQQVRSPVAMIGQMGCGKTTLLNAICSQNLGFSGGGGARSAVSLIVKHAEGAYSVKITYLSMAEIQETVALEISESTDVVDLLSSSDQLELSPIQTAALESLLVDPQKAARSQIAIEDLQPRFRDLVTTGTSTRSFQPNDIQTLVAHIADHADSGGTFWRVTKEVEVRGPFPGLHAGIEIMDLPGFGDTDEVRLLKIRQALERVHQVIVVADARGINREVQAALIDTGLVASILMSPHIDQITFVGTQIDHGRVSPSDQGKLKLPEDYTPAQAVRAQFNQWIATVRTNWERILHAQVAKAKGAAHKDVQVVMDKTRFIPASPEAYLCLTGLQRDPTGVYAKAFQVRNTKQAAAATGISDVQQALKQLLDVRKDLRAEKLAKLYAHICRFIHNSCAPLLKSLTSSVQVTKRETQEVDKCLRALVKLTSRKEVCCHLDKPVLIPHRGKLREVETIVADGWKGMNNANMQRVLTSHYGKMNYMILSATMRRKGIYAARDRERTRVNIPQLIGQNVRTRLMGFVNEELLPEFEDDLREAVESSVTELKSQADEFFESQDAVSGSLEMFWVECRTFLAQYEEETLLELENTGGRIKDLKVAVPDLADESIGEGFESLMNVALERGRGRGARQIMLEQFAQLAEQLRPDICKRTSQRFVERVHNEMTRICYDLESRLMDLRRLTAERMTNAKDRLSVQMGTKDKERLAKRLRAILERIPENA